LTNWLKINFWMVFLLFYVLSFFVCVWRSNVAF
jgi:hypothetical protein